MRKFGVGYVRASLELKKIINSVFLFGVIRNRGIRKMLFLEKVESKLSAS